MVRLNVSGVVGPVIVLVVPVCELVGPVGPVRGLVGGVAGLKWVFGSVGYWWDRIFAVRLDRLDRFLDRVYMLLDSL